MAHPHEANAILHDARGQTSVYADGATVTSWAPQLDSISGSGAALGAKGADTLPTFDVDGVGGEASINGNGSTATSLISPLDMLASSGDLVVAIRGRMADVTDQQIWRAVDGAQAATLQCYTSGTNAVVATGTQYPLQFISADTVFTIVARYNRAAQTTDLWVDGVKSAANGSAGSRTTLGLWLYDYPAAGTSRWGQLTIVEGATLSDAQCVALGEYLAAFDSDYSTGVARLITYADLALGSHLVVHEHPHAHRWEADFDGITPSALEGKYLTFSLWTGSTTTDHYLWFTWNGSGTDPSPGGTGHVVAGVTGDDIDDLVAKMVTVVDGITYLDAEQEGSVLRVEGTENGQVITAPVDVDTGALVTEIAEGGTSTATIDEIASTTIKSPQIEYSIVQRPRDIRSFFVKPGEKTWETIVSQVTLDGLLIPAGALQRRDRVYYDPA